MQQKVKGTPAPGPRQKLASYDPAGTSDGSQAALCQQLSLMQRDMSRTKAAIHDLLEMNKQILESMQDQNRSLIEAIRRIDKANRDSDVAVKQIADAAEGMKVNTDMIVQATLTAAYAIADDNKVEAASQRAQQEMKTWKAEQKAPLTIVSERA